MERLSEEDVPITQTAQPRSLTTLSETEKNLTIDKQTDEQVGLMLTLCNSLSELHDKLSKLSHVMEKKIIEHNLNQKGKGE